MRTLLSINPGQEVDILGQRRLTFPGELNPLATIKMGNCLTELLAMNMVREIKFSFYQKFKRPFEENSYHKSSMAWPRAFFEEILCPELRNTKKKRIPDL
jgi:hypothetical protein